MSLPRGQSGFVLMDVVVSLTVMVAVLGGTLVSFNGFEERTRANQVHNDAQDRARVGIDRLARELRNHASASPALPDGLEVAGPYELVALSTADGTPSTGNPRNSRRVRYCLDSSDQASARLVTQVQTWTAATPPARPSTASCPDAAWGASTVLAANVTNRAGGRDRPVFRYDSLTLSEINEVRTELFVDVEPARRPAETRLLSGVFLRNQNRPPTASFTATLSGRDHVLLNGSASQDPDGDSLTHIWLDGTSEIGRGPLLDYQAPSGTRSLTLRVVDTAGIATTSAPREVTIP